MEGEHSSISGSRMTLTETLHGIVCEVCNKRFSGRVPAEQHLQSATHLRKVQLQAQQSGHPLWCEVCSLQCNSPQQHATHQDSPRHQHMVKQLGIIREQHALTATLTTPGEQHGAEENPSVNVSHNQASHSLNISETHSTQRTSSLSESAGKTMNRPGEVPPGGVYFYGNRGYCHLCEIELTSVQHKTQHLEGKQHKKRALTCGAVGGGGAGGAGIKLGGGGEGIMMCSICQVPLSGQLNVEQHFSSPKHKARKAEHDRLEAMSGTAPQLSPLTTGASMSPAFQPRTALPDHGSFSPLHGPNSIPGRQMSFPGRDPSVQISMPSPSLAQPRFTLAPGSSQSTADVSYGTEDRKIECHMCQQYFRSREDAIRHLESVEHSRREEDLGKRGCEVCCVQYSGVASASQHLNSEKHKKRVQLTQGAGNSAAPNQSTDRADDLPLSESRSLQHLSEYRNLLTSSELSHRMSNHQELEETFRKMVLGESSVVNTPPSTPENSRTQARGQSLSPNFHPGSATTEEKVLNTFGNDTNRQIPFTQFNIPPSEFGQQQSSETPSTLPAYVFNGMRGKCNVCNIELTSKPHAESHLAGAKHKKALQRWSPSSSLRQGENSYPGGTTGGAPATGQAQFVPNVPDGATSPATRCYRFDGSRGYCFACKIELSSEAHANQHLVGKRHLMAAERWVQEGETRLYPLYCDVCNKPFTGQESAAQHFSSDKHKKKVSLAEGAEAQGKRDLQTGAVIILREGQMWYVCDVCKCPLNTPEQFKLHVNSPRHNAEVEKTKKQEENNQSVPVEISGIALTQPFSAAEAVVTGHDPADRHLLVTKSSVKVTPDAYVPPPQYGVTGLFRTETGYSGSTGGSQPGAPGQSHIGGRSALTGFSIQDSIRGRGRGCFNHLLRERSPVPPVSPGRTASGASHDSGGAGSPGLQEDGSLSSAGSQGQGHGRSGNRLSGDVLTDMSMGLGYRQVPRGGAGSSGRRTGCQMLRSDGQYEYDDDDEPTLPTSSSSSAYQDQDAERQDGGNGGSLAFSSIRGGNEMSQTASERRQGALAASTTSDNLSTSIHTDLGSLNVQGKLEAIRETTPEPPQPEENLFKGFRYSCKLCKQPMNTQEDYNRHMKGLKHQMKAATVSAPDRSGERLTKMEDYDVSFTEAYKCSKTTPRLYQVELMCKAMSSDSTVVYLPTGTGKTLAAMMTLSRMLTLNTTRPVLFLVDKVLLVLQQARYIINELGAPRTFNRPHLEHEGRLEERNLKVAVLCGGLSVRDGTPLWKHDVIVTTAAFCQNLLQDEVLRWANFSLVVFDEAHHCTKNHPYNKLLSEHHLSLPPERRPKVLGLTASPAGRRTKEETLQMLKDLLQNLGGATIATVEEKISKEQLDSYSSSARLVPVCVPMTEAEMGFHEKLLSYFIRAYVELMRCSNLQQITSRALQTLMRSKPPNVEDIKRFAQHLFSEPDELSEMVQLAQTARIKLNTVPLQRFENIRMHVMTVGMTLLNSEDGIDFVLDDLERLFNRNLNKCYDELVEMGLPCKEISTYVNTLCDGAKLRQREESERGVEGVGASPLTMSIFQELLGTLSNNEYMNWVNQDSMALVLVRERKVAHKFKDHLKKTSFVRERNMKVAVVVGHGAGSGEGEGMNLRKQDKVLQGIKSHRYNIVVATSVAEEGVDIPECQLVVCLNPPTTVKALVQMRGRARKKDSYFVVLCSSLREKEKLHELQQQELNMKWAAAELTRTNAGTAAAAAAAFAAEM